MISLLFPMGGKRHKVNVGLLGACFALSAAIVGGTGGIESLAALAALSGVLGFLLTSSVHNN